MKFLFYALLAWILFRWLDRAFRGVSSHQFRSPPPPPRPGPPTPKKPNSDKIGDYIDYEEVEPAEEEDNTK